MKLLLLIISLVLLLIGWISINQPIAITGAIVFIFYKLIDTFDIYRMAKMYRDGRDEEWMKADNKLKKVENFLNGLIVVVAMLAAIFGALSGYIIFFGAIFFYLLLGIIARNVAGIKLRMGYGGYYIPRYTRKYRSGNYKKRTSYKQRY